MIHAGKTSVRSRRDKQILAYLCCCEIIQSDWSEEFMWLFFYFYQSNYIISAKHNSATPKFVYDIGSWSWSYEQNMSINLCYTHFRALFLVEILEQPIRMLKNVRSIILFWKYLYRTGPWLPSWIWGRPRCKCHRFQSSCSCRTWSLRTGARLSCRKTSKSGGGQNLTTCQRYCKTDFSIKLWLDFDPWFEFVPATLHYEFEALKMLPL